MILYGTRFGDSASVELDGDWVRWHGRIDALTPLRRDGASEIADLQVIALVPRPFRGLTLEHLGMFALGIVATILAGTRWLGIGIVAATILSAIMRWQKPPHVLVLATADHTFAMIVDAKSFSDANAFVTKHLRLPLPRAIAC